MRCWELHWSSLRRAVELYACCGSHLYLHQRRKRRMRQRHFRSINLYYVIGRDVQFARRGDGGLRRIPGAMGSALRSGWYGRMYLRDQRNVHTR